MYDFKSSQLSRRMSLRQLQVFEAVARRLSFTRAAEELFLSQPTVSMQIKKLETEIGVPLTEQIGKKIGLTEAGNALYLASQDVLRTLGNFEMLIADQGLLTYKPVEAMSWESVKNLKAMKSIFILIQNIALQTETSEEITVWIDDVRDRLDATFEAIAEGEAQ